MIGGYESYFRSDYAYVGGFYNNLQKSGTEIGDYGKLNLKAGIVLNAFDVQLYADNLTNEDSITWIDAEGYPQERGNRLRPRTMGISIGYSF